MLPTYIIEQSDGYTCQELEGKNWYNPTICIRVSVPHDVLDKVRY